MELLSPASPTIAQNKPTGSSASAGKSPPITATTTPLCEEEEEEKEEEEEESSQEEDGTAVKQDAAQGFIHKTNKTRSEPEVTEPPSW